jgi:hypothetical protein
MIASKEKVLQSRGSFRSSTQNKLELSVLKTFQVSMSNLDSE